MCIIILFVGILVCNTAAKLNILTDLTTNAVDETEDKVNFSNFAKVFENIKFPEHLPSVDKSTNSSELIQRYGYNAEEHTVISNGYIRTLFRIKRNGPSVLLEHGLFLSSDTWLSLGENSLPFILASQGYDVWLDNARGNTYGRKHTHLSTTDPRFWEFSWHEIGTEDLSASIEYICETAGVKRLTFIGHSQGTTVAYVLLTEKPEYNEKLLGVISLASISFSKHAASPVFQFGAKIKTEVKAFCTALSLFELFPHRPPISTLTDICGSSKLISFACFSIIYSILGFDFDQIDYLNAKDQLRHVPGGASLQQVLHYLQLVNTGLFQKYDYGKVRNMIEYGSSVPPSYNIPKITTNMTIIYSNNDWLSNFKDVEQFIAQLPKQPEVFKVNLSSWNHVDYIWGKDANELVYSTVGKMVKIYNS